METIEERLIASNCQIVEMEYLADEVGVQIRNAELILRLKQPRWHPANVVVIDQLMSLEESFEFSRRMKTCRF